MFAALLKDGTMLLDMVALTRSGRDVSFGNGDSPASHSDDEGTLSAMQFANMSDRNAHDRLIRPAYN